MGALRKKDPQETQVDDNVVDMPYRSLHMNRRQNTFLMLLFAFGVAIASYFFFNWVGDSSHSLAAKYAVKSYPESPMSDLVKRQLPINNQYAEAGALMKGCPGGDNMPYPLTCRLASQAPAFYKKDLSASVTNANVMPAVTWNKAIRSYSKQRYLSAHKANATGTELVWKRIYDATRGPNDKTVAPVTPPETPCPTDQPLLGYGNCMNLAWATAVGLTIPDSRPWFDQNGINPKAFFLALLLFGFVSALFLSQKTRTTVGVIMHEGFPPFVFRRYFRVGLAAMFILYIAFNVLQK